MKRPIVREDCILGIRPCPWVSCEHHIVGFFVGRFWEKTDEEIIDHYTSLPYSCVLDIIDRNGACLLEEIGWFTGMSRERVRQLLDGADKKWGAKRRFSFNLHKILTQQEIQFVRGSL